MLRSVCSSSSVLSRTARLFPAVRFVTTAAVPAPTAAVPIERKKFKSPQRKASSLLNELRKIAFEKQKANRKYPLVRAGDSVEIEVLPYVTATTSDVVRGLVVAKTNNGTESTMTIINCEYGTPVKRLMKIYNPTIKRITILQKAFIYKGRKKVRRAKIYYMEKMDPKYWTIPY